MPSPKKTEAILDFIVANPEDQRSGAAMQKLGLTPQGINAWKAVRNNPEHPKATEVKNKVYDIIAANTPASQERGGVPFLDRFTVKNLLDREPELQQQYFVRKGFQTRIDPETKQLQVKKPGDPQYAAVDPEGFDLFDVFDVVGDVIEAGVTGIAGAAGGIAGSLPGAIAGGAGAAAAFETGKQLLGKAVGARETLSPGQVAQAGLIGGAATGVMRGAGKALEGAGKALGFGIGKAVPKKAAAESIEEASKEIGAKATPGQLIDSELVQKLESSLHQSVGKVGGMGLRSQIKSNQKAAQETADMIVKKASQQTAFEVGEQSAKDFNRVISEKLAPAEAIYNKYEQLFRNTPLIEKPNSALESIDRALDKFEFDDEAVAAIKSFAKKLDDVTTIDQLKKFRSAIGREQRSSQNEAVKQALGEIYQGTTGARSDALLKIAEFEGDSSIYNMAAKEIPEADRVYATVAREVQDVFGQRGRIIAGSPKAVAKKFFEKTPEINRINKIIATNDPAKIEKVKKAFPEAFERLREAKIDEIAKRSELKGEVNPNKLAKIVDKLPQETRLLLFGKDAAKKAEALKIYLDSIPPMLGPSGTPQGLEFLKTFNLISQATSVGRSQLLNMLSRAQFGRDLFSKTGRFLGTKEAVGAGAFGLRQVTPGNEQPPSFINLSPEFGGIQ